MARTQGLAPGTSVSFLVRQRGGGVQEGLRFGAQGGDLGGVGGLVLEGGGLEDGTHALG